MIANWVLVEPALGETHDQPGGLFRMVRDDAGFRIELLVGRKRWADRTALLAPYVFAGEHGAEKTDPVHAQLLEATYPWPHARHFKKQRR